MFVNLVQYYIVPVATCLCFLFFMYYNRLSSKSIMTYFFAGTICILCLILAEIGDLRCQTGKFEDVHNWQRYFHSAVGYTLRPAFAFIIMLIPLRNRGTKYLWLTAIPLAINIIFLIISAFNGMVFSFDTDNHYHGGSLNWFPTVVALLYTVAFLTISALQIKHNEFQEFATCTFISAMCFLATYLESEYDLRGLLTAAYVTGEIFYFMFFFVNKYSKDTLTGAYMRDRFYQDTRKIGFQYFILFDINGLKKINDDLGHIEGDKALQGFAKASLSVLPKRADLYRLGGDEFAILYRGAEEREVKLLLLKIKEKLEKVKTLPFGFSAGYSWFEGEETFNTAYKRADNMLYENKNAFWESYRRNGSDNN